MRDRISELIRVPASSIEVNPKNWRKHSRFQGDVLRSMVDRVGFATALVCYRTETGKLRLIDGHLRQDEYKDQILPVIVLDVTEEEASELLATIDPLAALAEANEKLLGELISGIDIQDCAPLSDMFDQLLAETGEICGLPGPKDPEIPAEPIERAEKAFIAVIPANQEEWKELVELLQPEALQGSGVVAKWTVAASKLIGMIKPR